MSIMRLKAIGYTLLAATMYATCCSPNASKAGGSSADAALVAEPSENSSSVGGVSAQKSKKTTNVTTVPKFDKKENVLSDSWNSVLEKIGHKTKVSSSFFKQVVDFSREIKTDPIDFTFIMFQESKFNPSAKSAGGYVGLIQMDKTSFKDCALRMLEFEKYKKDHPKENISLVEYIDKSLKSDFKKPNIGKDKISFDQYKRLSAEKQFKYTKAYLKYRIYENSLKGKKIPSNQLWALIHRPADCKKSSELNGRARLLNAVKNGGTFGGVKIKGVKEISPLDYRRIVRL